MGAGPVGAGPAGLLLPTCVSDGFRHQPRLWKGVSARRTAASNHPRGCPALHCGYSHFSSSRLPRLGMNIYVGVLINNQPMSTADANYANIIPCRVKFVIPSLCYPVQCLSWSDMQLLLSRVILLKCIISIMIVKSTFRFPGWEISPCNVPGAFAALQIHRHHQEHSRTPQKSTFEVTSAWWIKASHS